MRSAKQGAAPDWDREWRVGGGVGEGGICRMNPKKNILPFDTVICNLTVERLSPRENPALAA